MTCGKMAVSVDCDFPTWGLLPKKETGVTSFLIKYPTYDGRGTVMAIFDSGVDPGAPGMQVTSEGRPKVIERHDCSGAGDVDCSKVVEAVGGEIVGLSGRTLKIPESWVNPTGFFHVGIKNGFDLYPTKLRERLEKERKERLWDSGQKKAVADATKRLNDLEAATPNPAGEEKVVKEDVEAQLELLAGLEKKYHDVGPAYDCIVFNDGEVWRACIDTSECGQLAGCPTVGEYSLTREFAALTPSDQLNFSVNVHNDGALLEIVSMCSSHGTHVASIAAACFPDEPEKNGCAPGAQIISLTIGDNRLGSMETGTALVRAMIRVMSATDLQPKVDLINMSYGEHAHFSCSGRIGDLMNEVVDKHRVVWIGSAGNHGPALCTIGTPPDISTNNIIGVGAYVSPDMMAAEYALRQKLPGMPYTWSSRGPTIDGDVGVSVCAPGGAITSVPGFTLRNSQLMNGTSMASPHVCGATALLLSALKERQVPYSPYSMKRALENSAQYLDNVDVFAQGYGLLQVEKALDHLLAYRGQPEREVRFQLSCSPYNAKGIHLRGGLQDKAREHSVNVEPFFADPENIDPQVKIDFSMNLSLTCGEPWVQFPTYLNLMNIARMFTVKIDPSGLPTGVHATSINAYDVACVEKGPVFRIPITVVRPVEIPRDQLRPELSFADVQFRPNTVQRLFVLVPPDATWAVLDLQCKDKDNIGKFVIHTLQLRPKLVCKTLESYKVANVSSNCDVVHGFSVRGSVVLEVVIAKYWASLGDLCLNYRVTFHGVKVDTASTIVMQGADGILSMELHTGLLSEEIAPVVTLKNSVQVLRPNESKVVPLLARDVIPPARQIYELQLTYNFHIHKATEVTPNCPLLSDLLYESEFESQLWMLFDANRQLLATGDAYPGKYNVKVEKGDYVVRLHVRHDRKEQLDKLMDLVLQMSQKLATPVTLDVYSTQSQATTQGKKLASANLLPNHIVPIYITPLNPDKSAKGSYTGQFLSGVMSFARDEIGKRVDTHHFKYVLPEPPKKAAQGGGGAKANSNSDANKDRSKWEEMTEAVRDLRTSWLAKIEPGEKADQLYEELKTDYPDHLPIHLSMLQLLEPCDLKTQLLQVSATLQPADPWEPCDATAGPDHKYARIIVIADVILSKIDQAELLSFYGTKADQRMEAQRIKSSMDRLKSALLEALWRKGVALCKQHSLAQPGPAQEALVAQIDQVWSEFIKFADLGDTKQSVYFCMWRATHQRHHGRLLKLLQRMSEDKSTVELDLAIARTCDTLGWPHVARQVRASIPVRHPVAYRPF